MTNPTAVARLPPSAPDSVSDCRSSATLTKAREYVAPEILTNITLETDRKDRQSVTSIDATFLTLVFGRFHKSERKGTRGNWEVFLLFHYSH